MLIDFLWLLKIKNILIKIANLGSKLKIVLLVKRQIFHMIAFLS